MSLKKKYLIHLSLFLVVFTSLLLVATFYDLEISKLLAGGGLKEGSYYTTNVFGRFFEYIGSWPIFLFGTFACLVFMHKIYHLESKLKYLAVLFVFLIIFLIHYCFDQSFGYYCKNNDIVHIFEKSITTIILWVLAIIAGAVVIYFYRNVELEKNNKLFNFALVILCAAVFYASIELIKGPVGRMRFRAMHLINDFSYFTPWYQISSAKELVGTSIVPKDGFKSFPSGHTFSAGVSYVLICMPLVYDKFNNKKWTIIWYAIPVIFTGLVGLARIVAGAHYMSDVLVGGTIAYVATEVFKYVFLVRKKS